jgi:hypothetical protein
MGSAAFIIAKQNQYLRRFREAGAVSPDTALSLEQAGCRDSRMFRSLVRREVIRQTPEGKYYLDLKAAQAFRQARHERALTALVIVLAMVAVLVYFIMKM